MNDHIAKPVDPVHRMEGVDLIWRPHWQNVSFTVQPFVGSGKLDLANEIKLEARDLWGINLVAERGDFSLRFGHTAAKLTLKNSSFEPDARRLLLNPALIPIPGGSLGASLGTSVLPSANAMLADLAPDGKQTTFTSIGANWDNGDYFISGEYAQRRIDMAVPDTTSWYLTAGLRRDRWTPFITYSNLRIDSDVAYTSRAYSTGLPVPGVDALANQVLSELGKEINVANPTDQYTWSLGARYDIQRGMGLKVQWDIVHTGQSNNGIQQWHGLFANRTASFENGPQHVNVLSVALDFVF